MIKNSPKNKPSRLISVEFEVEYESGTKPKKTVWVTQKSIAEAVGYKTPVSVKIPYELLTCYVDDFRKERKFLLSSLSNPFYSPEYVANEYMIWCLVKFRHLYVIKPQSEGRRVTSRGSIEYSLQRQSIQKYFSRTVYEHQNPS